jgi:hypothetical protein
MGTGACKVGVHKNLHNFQEASFERVTSVFIGANTVSKSGTGEIKDGFMPCAIFTQLFFFSRQIK